MNTLSTSFAERFYPLIRPHPSLTDIQTRRQSVLLAALILTLVMTSGLASLAFIIRAQGSIPPLVLPLTLGQLLSLALYVLNRRGNYQRSAQLFVALNFVVVYGSTFATRELAWLFFAPMLILFSAILMPFNTTRLIFIASIAVQIAMGVFYPLSTQFSNISAFFIFFVTSAMVIVFLAHRVNLERERQQELRTANEKLRESEAVLEKRVAERTAELEIARHEAESARDRAVNADKIKSQFLASMSHELRTPLNAILTFNELLAMGTFGPVNAEQVDYLQKSLQSGKHLLALINDVLDITKIQSGMMKLFLENDFNVNKEVESVAATAEKMLKDKPVQLVLDIDEDLPLLTCDKRRIRQVLLNLMSNAVKFTESGSITLSAKRHSDHLLFAVIDTGPGVPADQQEIIFQPFIQTETGIKHAGGTGLGLPISLSIAQTHGGKLWIESEAGEGAAFFFQLPLQAQAKPNQAQV